MKNTACGSDCPHRHENCRADCLAGQAEYRRTVRERIKRRLLTKAGLKGDQYGPRKRNNYDE